MSKGTLSERMDAFLGLNEAVIQGLDYDLDKIVESLKAIFTQQPTSPPLLKELASEIEYDVRNTLSFSLLGGERETLDGFIADRLEKEQPTLEWYARFEPALSEIRRIFGRFELVEKIDYALEVVRLGYVLITMKGDGAEKLAQTFGAVTDAQPVPFLGNDLPSSHIFVQMFSPFLNVDLQARNHIVTGKESVLTLIGVSRSKFNLSGNPNELEVHLNELGADQETYVRWRDEILDRFNAAPITIESLIQTGVSNTLTQTPIKASCKALGFNKSGMRYRIEITYVAEQVKNKLNQLQFVSYNMNRMLSTLQEFTSDPALPCWGRPAAPINRVGGGERSVDVGQDLLAGADGFFKMTRKLEGRTNVPDLIADANSVHKFIVGWTNTTFVQSANRAFRNAIEGGNPAQIASAAQALADAVARDTKSVDSAALLRGLKQKKSQELIKNTIDIITRVKSMAENQSGGVIEVVPGRVEAAVKALLTKALRVSMSRRKDDGAYDELKVNVRWPTEPPNAYNRFNAGQQLAELDMRWEDLSSVIRASFVDLFPMHMKVRVTFNGADNSGGDYTVICQLTQGLFEGVEIHPNPSALARELSLYTVDPTKPFKGRSLVPPPSAPIAPVMPLASTEPVKVAPEMSSAASAPSAPEVIPAGMKAVSTVDRGGFTGGEEVDEDTFSWHMIDAFKPIGRMLKAELAGAESYITFEPRDIMTRRDFDSDEDWYESSFVRRVKNDVINMFAKFGITHTADSLDLDIEDDGISMLILTPGETASISRSLGIVTDSKFNPLPSTNKPASAPEPAADAAPPQPPRAPSNGATTMSTGVTNERLAETKFGFLNKILNANGKPRFDLNKENGLFEITVDGELRIEPENWQDIDQDDEWDFADGMDRRMQDWRSFAAQLIMAYISTDPNMDMNGIRVMADDMGLGLNGMSYRVEITFQRQSDLEDFNPKDGAAEKTQKAFAQFSTDPSIPLNIIDVKGQVFDSPATASRPVFATPEPSSASQVTPSPSVRTGSSAPYSADVDVKALQSALASHLSALGSVSETKIVDAKVKSGGVPQDGGYIYFEIKPPNRVASWDGDDDWDSWNEDYALPLQAKVENYIEKTLNIDAYRYEADISDDGRISISINSMAYDQLAAMFARGTNAPTPQSASSAGQYDLDDLIYTVKKAVRWLGDVRTDEIDGKGNIYVEIDPDNRERLDHYGNDGDGWDEDAWNEDFADPLYYKAARSLAEIGLSAQANDVDIYVDEKGYLNVIVNPENFDKITGSPVPFTMEDPSDNEDRWSNSSNRRDDDGDFDPAKPYPGYGGTPPVGYDDPWEDEEEDGEEDVLFVTDEDIEGFERALRSVGEGASSDVVTRIETVVSGKAWQGPKAEMSYRLVFELGEDLQLDREYDEFNDSVRLASAKFDERKLKDAIEAFTQRLVITVGVDSMVPDKVLNADGTYKSLSIMFHVVMDVGTGAENVFLSEKGIPHAKDYFRIMRRDVMMQVTYNPDEAGDTSIAPVTPSMSKNEYAAAIEQNVRKDLDAALSPHGYVNTLTTYVTSDGLIELTGRLSVHSDNNNYKFKNDFKLRLNALFPRATSFVSTNAHENAGDIAEVTLRMTVYEPAQAIVDHGAVALMRNFLTDYNQTSTPPALKATPSSDTSTSMKTVAMTSTKSGAKNLIVTKNKIVKSSIVTASRDLGDMAKSIGKGKVDLTSFAKLHKDSSLDLLLVQIEDGVAAAMGLLNDD